MALETKKGSLQTIEDMEELYFALAGNAKASTTDSQRIPFIDATGGLDIEDELTKGMTEDITYGQGAKKLAWTVKTPASDFGLWAVLNAFVTPIAANDTVTHDQNGRLFVFGKNKNGDVYSHWQSPNLQDYTGTPGCSSSMTAQGSKFHNGNDGRYIEFHFQGWESAAQEAYRCGLTVYDTAAAIAGVTTSGATLVTASRAARVLDKGFHTCTVGGTDMGILTDAMVEDEIMGGQLQQGQYAVLQRKVTAKAETNQASLNQQTSFTALADIDTTVVMKSYAGETVTINNARIHLKSALMRRSKNFIGWELSSTMPLSAAVFTGTTATYTCDAA